LISEGTQVALATLQTFADGDQAAPQTNASKLIVIYCNSKISLHFREDGKILCEGVKVNSIVEQNLPLPSILTIAAAAAASKPNGLIGCNNLVGYNGLVSFIGLGLVGFIGLGLVSLASSVHNSVCG
jgi:hypothetical protein